MASVFLFVFFLLSYLLLLHSAEEVRYTKNCPPSRCGNVEMTGFPFTNTSKPGCGVFTVDCRDPYPTIQPEVGGRPYEVEEIINEHNTIRVNEFWKHPDFSICESFTNLSFPSNSSVSFEISHNQTFFKCKRNISVPDNLKKKSCKDDYNIYYSISNDIVPSNLSRCSFIQLPKNLDPPKNPDPLFDDDYLFALLTPKFDLIVDVSEECKPKWKLNCGGADKGSKKRKLAIGLATLAFGIGVLVMMVVIYCFKTKFSSNKIIYFWKKESLNHQTVQAFLRNHGPLAIRRYNYSNIKKMTNFFKDKLGEGGYGGVYKEKLQDGCLVAVKVLKESRDNGDEFINEVASISRTSHVNIVSLMGFCFEGSKRALIYQFMPNGSLEKFIYKENPLKNDRRLEWETLYKIALGIARGLEYLHRGCNTQILHFDIKPHNILLDENFCPKISDFGLAKICPREKSIVSMLGARGTAGYIAPEVFCRNFGNISHKSDVYSYGMMVFEMVGGRRNIDADIDHTSEIFFPHLIYKRLQQDEDLGLQSLMNEKDHESARKMIIISLWCIQSDPSIRPPMSSVVNMLEGSLESLPIPPKPFLFSPSRSSKDSSTTMGSLQYNSVMS